MILDIINKSAPKILSTRLNLKKPMRPQLIPPIISRARISFLMKSLLSNRIFTNRVYNIRQMCYNVFTQAELSRSLARIVMNKGRAAGISERLFPIGAGQSGVIYF